MGPENRRNPEAEDLSPEQSRRMQIGKCESMRGHLFLQGDLSEGTKGVAMKARHQIPAILQRCHLLLCNAGMM